MSNERMGPTEYFDGAWRFPLVEGPEPLAIVTWAEEPSPETGHAGWCWWALGTTGDADTYDAACAAAEDAMRRKGSR